MLASIAQPLPPRCASFDLSLTPRKASRNPRIAALRSRSSPHAIHHVFMDGRTANRTAAAAAADVAPAIASSIAGLPPGCQWVIRRRASQANASAAKPYDQTPGWEYQLAVKRPRSKRQKRESSKRRAPSFGREGC